MKTAWMTWAAVMAAAAMIPLGCGSVEIDPQPVEGDPQPIAKECWSALEGDPCATVGDTCGQADGPCDTGFVNTCGEDRQWHVAILGGDCPPPLGDYCLDNGTQTECETDPSCRWLTPGCGDFPLAAPGCFTTSDCSAVGCDPGTTCTQVSFNPCAGQACDACGAQTTLCLATTQ